MKLAIAWITTAIVFLALDFLWLSAMSQRLYKPLLGDLLSPTVNIAPAIAFYLIYVSGLVMLAVLPGLERASLMKAIVHGAALGLVAYATYDLTNQATLRTWDIKITLADLAWGTFLSAAASGAAFLTAARVS